MLGEGIIYQGKILHTEAEVADALRGEVVPAATAAEANGYLAALALAGRAGVTIGSYIRRGAGKAAAAHSGGAKAGFGRIASSKGILPAEAVMQISSRVVMLDEGVVYQGKVLHTEVEIAAALSSEVEPAATVAEAQCYLATLVKGGSAGVTIGAYIRRGAGKAAAAHSGGAKSGFGRIASSKGILPAEAVMQISSRVVMLDEGVVYQGKVLHTETEVADALGGEVPPAATVSEANRYLSALEKAARARVRIGKYLARPCGG